MRIEYFGCDATIEAKDGDTVIEGFLAHASGSRDRPYPEHALRRYARIFPEALERLDEIGEITIHPVTEGRCGDHSVGLWLPSHQR